MAAVAEAAREHVRAEFAKALRHLLGRHMPQAKLANTGRVYAVTAEREVIKPRVGGGVAAFLLLFRQSADFDVVIGQKRLNDRRLAHPRLADEDTDTAAQVLAQLCHTRFAASGYLQGAVTQATIAGEQLRQWAIGGDEIALIKQQ